MNRIAPFADPDEFREYAALCGLEFEKDAVGFKVFEEETGAPRGALIFKTVHDFVYLVGIANAKGVEDRELLENSLRSVLGFFVKIGIHCVVFPIQTANDQLIAEALDFDRISDTLYSLEFTEKKEEENETV